MSLNPVLRRFALPTAALTFSAVALLSGCGSAGSSSTAAADPHSSGSGSATGYPTTDVVSSISEDASLHAALLTADPSASSGQVTLGTTYNPGLTGLPHSGQNSAGQNIGADVDLRDAVAKVLGISWSVQNGTFDTIIPGVQNGKYAVGQDNFGVTSAREKEVDFATYLTDGQSLLAPSSSTLNKVTDITQLCGLTVGTSAGTTFQTILTKNASKCAAAGKAPYTVQYFSDNSAIWLGLANGRIDVYFGPTLGLEYDATHVPNVKFLSQISTTPVGFVVAKDSPLAKLIAEAVNKLISSGDYAKILAKWSITGNGVAGSQVNPAPTL